MCQISSLMAAAEGPVAEFSSFANLEEKKRKSNLLMSFPKTANQMGSFGQIRKNSFFCFCRPILDIFGLTLLSIYRAIFHTRRVRDISHVVNTKLFLTGLAYIRRIVNGSRYTLSPIVQNCKANRRRGSL